MAYPPASRRRPLHSGVTIHGASLKVASTSTLTAVLLLLLTLSSSWITRTVDAFPIIAEVDESETKCFRFNIPEDDDAHMVFVALPGGGDDEIEDYFVASLDEMTRQGGEKFMHELPNMPDEILKKVAKEMHTNVGDTTKVFLKVQKPRRPILRHQLFRWFLPIIMKDVVKSSAEVGQEWDSPLGGYSICFENNSRDQAAKIVFDVVLVSDEGDKEGGKKKKKLIKKEHLTPLEENFRQSISTANQILNEMRYMEKREARMRQTAESTNVRIRYFSYLSVAILLGVTWMQVTYLKSYFRKKKLM